MRILSKKAFRFQKPGSSVLGDTAGDSGNLNKPQAYEDIYFVTKPNEVQEAPDWIKRDKMFKLAAADGDLMEVMGSPKVAQTDIDKQAAAKQAQAARDKADKDDKAQKVADDQARAQQQQASSDVNLQRLNKEDLLAHAKEVHGLEFDKDDPAHTKAHIIEKIEEKQNA